VMDGWGGGVVGDLAGVPVAEDLHGGGLEIGDTAFPESAADEGDGDEELGNGFEGRDGVELLELGVVDFGHDNLDC
jgi:hypothetical protein